MNIPRNIKVLLTSDRKEALCCTPFRETVAGRIGGGKRERLLLPGETLAAKKFGEFGALRFYDIQSSICWLLNELVMMDSQTLWANLRG
ncbi:hypothetical protein CDAR_25101 [Caerostris darwini]|uniref:Uncharacterized protein n=1 Tax=Caerostris darwini TaxID=1538125 RepID=A0AAV4N114_9ARAC|nr:hypothetical protein CDAR_25101 [Caerostris darwini]